ncbi:tetratricopeptide repeat protein [Stella humosa]|uniref:Tetratricopeptide repeat protein n=1 Tax=Stella humosa TaxID=94 RepID=A0A3N1LIK9_9PROT|nr:tetratricopeptide repeat protein [Stella humosa]ROP91367.1 tetratricopeptide repeat protein [Stella humosa]BBK34273.1 hypothetical protein STHU_49070 [Stella humosa]
MRCIPALALLVLALAPPAAADQTDPRLPGLFARLEAPAAADAKAVEATIWQLWAITDVEEAIIPYRRGVAALEEARLEDALALFVDVTDKAPEFAEGWNKRATVLFHLGRYRESATAVARTLALEPRHFGAWAGLGLIRQAEGRDGEALAAFERGLAVNPHMPGVAAATRDLGRRLRGRAI